MTSMTYTIRYIDDFLLSNTKVVVKPLKKKVTTATIQVF